MIKHSLKEDQIHLSIDNRDFSYRIPVKNIGKTINWKVGDKSTEGIVMNNVSKWTLQLFTKDTTEDKFVEQFQSIVQENAPKNSIDWKETLLAVKIQNQYNYLSKINASAKEKLNEEEILSRVEEKFKLD
ncbi:MAG TPA: hypothetical protein VKY37_11395 [Brumimicrobium sp.]|nr:hypothetical protein [Brumimicrobium sp.]